MTSKDGMQPLDYPQQPVQRGDNRNIALIIVAAIVLPFCCCCGLVGLLLAFVGPILNELDYLGLVPVLAILAQ